MLDETFDWSMEDCSLLRGFDFKAVLGRLRTVGKRLEN